MTSAPQKANNRLRVLRDHRRAEAIPPTDLYSARRQLTRSIVAALAESGDTVNARVYKRIRPSYRLPA